MTNTTGNPRSPEMRIRDKARRQELALRKSRRRDPQAPDYNGHWLVPARQSNGKITRIVYGGRHGTTLEAIETWLDTPRDQR